MSDSKGPPLFKLLGGDGSKERPYVIGQTSSFFSTGMQMKIIEDVHGAGEYSPDSRQRHYYQSPKGPPGNKDLCEHVLLKSGKSVWFDLSEVSKYEAAHPNAMEESMKVLGADQEQIASAKQHVATGGESGLPKRSGCLGVIVLAGVTLAGLLFFVIRGIAAAR